MLPTRITTLILGGLVFQQNVPVVSARFLAPTRRSLLPDDLPRIRRPRPQQTVPIVNGGHQIEQDESLQDNGDAADNGSTASFTTNLQNRLDHIRSSAKALVARVQSTTKLGASVAGEEGAKSGRAFFSALGPSLLALWATGSDKQILSFLQVYCLSLLGSSVGFYSFLYFISVGYALGISIPLVAALSLYMKRQRALLVPPMPATTFWHTGLVIIWGIRAVAFFLWREFVNWPALHAKIRQVSARSAPAVPVKFVIWIMYSFLYVAMLSPCWFRIQHAATTLSSASSSSLVTRLWQWISNYVPLLIQVTGLTLETLADHQKSTFKRHHRYEWCHEGLWKWSTHPNYLGEWIFWTGTYLGYVLFVASSKTHVPAWPTQMAFSTVGYIFISTVLRGSIQSMGNKHLQKYGHLEEYGKFRQTHGLVGPKLRHNKRLLMETVENSTTEQQEPVEANTSAA